MRALGALALAALAWGVHGCSAQAPPAERPNILFAFADDWGRHASIYAEVDGPGSPNDVIHTPHFDRVAREGVLFRHAFTNAPSCTPSRSALLSGQHFWRTGRGAILVGAVWDDAIPTYPLLLREAGYHIGKMYKVWSPGSPVDAPYGGQQFAYEQAGRRFNQFSQHVTQMVREGMTVDAAKEALYDEVIANVDAFLADREPGQPFCFWFGPTNVHRKWIRGSGKALWGIDPDELEGRLPPFLPDVPAVREDLADYFGEIRAFDEALGRLLAKLEEIGELENTLVVASGDHGAPGFPHGKTNLYDFGTAVPLAVRWGDRVGSLSRRPGDGRRDSDARGGRVVDDLVTLTDLAPTFLEVAGVSIPDTMRGLSLVALLQSDKSGQVDPQRTAVLTGRERHVENARADYTPYPQRAIRTPEHLYIINFRPDRWPAGDPYRLDGDNPPTAEEITEVTRSTLPDEDAGPTKAWLVGQRETAQWRPLYELAYGKRPREELYVLADDPQQVHNVADDPRYEQVRRELHERLMVELKRTGDPRVIDNGAYFETPPLAGPLTDNPAGKPRARE
ncbi:MAG: sulfatase-like hydrolase/transferase [Luteitalea sp.]|nr:sulfatase-like hydrolase/transferase [Luteitalea sp.]